jgi:DNA-binding CsgD family transcriptional regulator
MTTRRPRRPVRDPAPGKDRSLTKAERDEAKMLWAGGRTVAQIAKTLGRTVAEVTFVAIDQPPAEVREVDDTPGRLR